MSRHIRPYGHRPKATHHLHPSPIPSQINPRHPFPSPNNPHPPIPSPFNPHPPIPSPFNPHLIVEPSNPTINLYPSPDYEQRLRDEVLYLHSLWHRGTPGNPTTIHTAPRSPYLKPSTSNIFKKKKKKKKRDHTNIIKQNQVSDKEWPVNSPPPDPSPTETGWGPFKPPSEVTTRVASEEEQTRIIAIRIQRKCLDTCVGFFKKNDDGDDDEEDEDDDIKDCQEFEFFLKLFEGDNDLRGYYEKNWESGEFLCLVCSATGTKIGRKFKNTVALVQHSITISKTKRRKAHRAYGKVISMVHGWDINRLPSIVLAVGDTLDQSFRKSDEVQGAERDSDHGVENALDGIKWENNPPNAENSQFVPEAINAADKKDDATQDAGTPLALDSTTYHFEAGLTGDSANNNQEGCP